MQTIRKSLSTTCALLLLFVAGCSDDDNPTNGGNGGGNNTREFSSPDLNTGNSFTHVFTTAEVVPYHCSHHGGPGGVGMSGVITVVAGGTPNTHSFSIVDNTLPSESIDVGDTVTWTNNHGLVHNVRSDN